MDDKYISKLSPTVDFWAGIYLVIIGKYIISLPDCVNCLSSKINIFSACIDLF